MAVESVLTEVRAINGTGKPDAARVTEEKWRSFLDAKPAGHDRCIALTGLGEALAAQGKHGEAEDAFRAALTNAVGNVDRITALVGYAKLVCDVRLHLIADHVAANLLSSLTKNPDEVRGVAPWGYAYHSSLLVLSGNLADAYASARMAVDAAYALTPPAGLAEAYQALADVQKVMGDLRGAMASLEEAMVVMRQGNCLMEARADYAQLAISVGDVATAERCLARAVEYIDLRQHRPLGKVLRSIQAVMKIDPDVGVRLLDVVASRLEGTGVSLVLGGE